MILDTRKEAALEINAEKTKYMFMYHLQDAGKETRVTKQLMNPMKMW
jgi:hypothetical protein